MKKQSLLTYLPIFLLGIAIVLMALPFSVAMPSNPTPDETVYSYTSYFDFTFMFGLLFTGGSALAALLSSVWLVLSVINVPLKNMRNELVVLGVLSVFFSAISIFVYGSFLSPIIAVLLLAALILQIIAFRKEPTDVRVVKVDLKKKIYLFSCIPLGTAVILMVLPFSAAIPQGILAYKFTSYFDFPSLLALLAFSPFAAILSSVWLVFLIINRILNKHIFISSCVVGTLAIVFSAVSIFIFGSYLSPIIAVLLLAALIMQIVSLKPAKEKV